MNKCTKSNFMKPLTVSQTQLNYWNICVPRLKERIILPERRRIVNWNDYKLEIKRTDPVGKEIIEEAEIEAAIISDMIRQRSAMGLSQRELAEMCDIPQSSIARIETGKITPRLDTLLKILKQLGLTLSVTETPTLSAVGKK